MRISINKKYIAVAFIILFVEIIIAIFMKDKIIRPFVGDVLSTCLLFCLGRSFYKGKTIWLGIGVLFFAFAVEFSQLYKLGDYLGFEKGSIGSIVLGATFDPLDLVAYLLGVFLCLIFDSYMK